MILMNDFQKEYTFLKPAIDKSVSNVFGSGRYILGKEVEEFEKEFSNYIGTNYCIGVANGLEALQISLMALGIGKGDEIITVSNTAVATVLAITNVGAKPVFVDINDYYLMDTTHIEVAITKRTKAILPVHLFGQMADMNVITEIAKRHNLFVIEDACQAHGATQNGKKAGSLGGLGCFSFYPTKNLGAYGDGGAITTNSRKLYEKCKMLRNYGQKNRYMHEVKGINSRLDEVQAAILSVKLKYLDSFVSKRNQIANIYKDNLKDIQQIKLPQTKFGNHHGFHLYVIETEKRDELMKFLADHDVQTLIHYPLPVHKQVCYTEYNNISLPETEERSKQILSLPINSFICRNEVEMICSIIKNFYQ